LKKNWIEETWIEQKLDWRKNGIKKKWIEQKWNAEKMD
jgi:hypothetical protein